MKKINEISKYALGADAIGVVFTLLVSLRGAKFGEIIRALPILLLPLIPFVLLALMALLLNDNKKQHVIILIGSVILVSSALYVYAETFLFHPDAQGGLIFLFFPLIQLVGVFILWLLASLFRNTNG